MTEPAEFITSGRCRYRGSGETLRRIVLTDHIRQDTPIISESESGLLFAHRLDGTSDHAEGLDLVPLPPPEPEPREWDVWCYRNEALQMTCNEPNPDSAARIGWRKIRVREVRPEQGASVMPAQEEVRRLDDYFDTMREHERSRPPENPFSRPAGSDGMPAHELSIHLIRSFSTELLAKLRKAEDKYGYGADWNSPEWPVEDCRAAMLEHIAKGDPRDVAIYCAFLWFRNASTAPDPSREPEAGCKYFAIMGKFTGRQIGVCAGARGKEDALRASDTGSLKPITREEFEAYGETDAHGSPLVKGGGQ